MSKEIWKDIEGFPGYQVSNQGRVRNVKKNFICKLTLDKSTGYMRVNLLGTDDKRHVLGVHTLVAKTFIPNPENKRIPNHLDTNKTNNNVSNLMWATDSENMKHAFNNGLCEKTRESARKQIKYLQSLPKTDRQRESARENIIKINKRPKTERQKEAARKNINSEVCRQRSTESHYARHPSIKLVETGEVFKSQRELAEILGINESAICACLKKRRTQASGYHFEYVDDNEKTKTVKQFLYDYQMAAVKKLQNGSVLCGGVGSGKSRTGLYYYFKENGGSFVNQEYIPMQNPQDLYIITTAMKRDTHEWDSEIANYRLSADPGKNELYNNKIVIDSWNNIKKYANVTNAFFLFDEQRVCGSGVWVKSFLRIAKNNNWILLSATPGDSFEDYIPLFIANGFYKNRTEFQREHIVYSRFTKYPQVERYINTGRLIRLRDKILVDMDFSRPTTAHHEDIYVKYDISKYKDAIRNRWDPFRDEPIQQASQLCYVLRRIVNEDESRVVALMEILEKTPKAIIFYNFNYERDMLLHLLSDDEYVGYEVAEWSGHAHMPVPKSDRWVYLCQYTSGNSGWNCILTDTIIFFSQNYSYKVMEQACGRIDRLNTPYKDLYYYHIKSRSGIDMAITKALNKKKKFNERKFAGWDSQ